MPAISVITPSYNRAYVLPDVIRSIQAQDFSDWEMIIVDDGSTDGTETVVQPFVEQDSRIQYITQDNAGASAARNCGVMTSSADIVVYVDSDDPVYPNFLSSIYAALGAHPEKSYGVCNHLRRIQLVDENRNILAEKEPYPTLEGTVTLQQFYHWEVKTTSTGMFHRRELYSDAVRWDEDLYYIEDWDLLMQFGNKYPEQFLHIPDVLFEYRQIYGTTDGMCSNATYKNWGEAFGYIFEKHKDDPLMAGQQWHPDRVERYAALHEQALRGEIKPAMYKYFPEFEVETS